MKKTRSLLRLLPSLALLLSVILAAGSGCSLLGDGTICLQLDIEDLARNTGGGKTHE